MLAQTRGIDPHPARQLPPGGCQPNKGAVGWQLGQGAPGQREEGIPPVGGGGGGAYSPARGAQMDWVRRTWSTSMVSGR